MTEKRFISKGESIINVVTDELVNASSEVGAEILVGWLNELSEENEQLKLFLEALKEELSLANRDNTALEKENGRLESELDYYKAKSGSCEEGLFQQDREISKLKKENEQLRKEKECDKQVFTKKQLHERLQQTRKENEQLKKELDQFYLLIGKGDWSGLVDLIKGDVE